MIIAKFGGTSIATKERVLTLCNIVESELEKEPVVVVSAIRGITDLLLSLPDLSKINGKKELKRLKSIHLNLFNKLINDKNIRQETEDYIDGKIKEIENFLKKNMDKVSLDILASYGEIISSFIIVKALESKDIKVSQVIATKVITTNDNFGSAEFLVSPTKRNCRKILLPLLKKGIVPVVTGFIGSNKNGQTTTLGRGGSDYSASIIGFCLNASEIQIWTDVDGIFTSDPKVIVNAKPLPEVSFKEASELAAFGARVLHPGTIRPAIYAGIPVRVLNTFNPGNSGTLIEEKSRNTGIVKTVSFKRKVILVNIYATEMLLQKGFLAQIFKIFANNNISIDLVSVSEVSVSVTLDTEESLESAVNEINKFASVTVFKNFGMVSLIGEGITSSTKTIKKVFEILDKEGILARTISLSAANINISIVVESLQVETAVKLLHDGLIV